MDNDPRPRPSAPRRDDALVARESEIVEKELLGLPELEAPGELWVRIRDRLDEARGAAQPASRRWRRRAPLALAAAIGLFAFATMLLFVDPATDDPARTDRTAVASNAPSKPPVVGIEDPPGTEPLDHAAVIEALLAQSRQAEARRRAVLAFYSPTGPEQVLRAHIGDIDAALNEQMFSGDPQPKFREALLRDRVELIADLTDIERYRQHEFVHRVSL